MSKNKVPKWMEKIFTSTVLRSLTERLQVVAFRLHYSFNDLGIYTYKYGLIGELYNTIGYGIFSETHLRKLNDYKIIVFRQDQNFDHIELPILKEEMLLSEKRSNAAKKMHMQKQLQVQNKKEGGSSPNDIYISNPYLNQEKGLKKHCRKSKKTEIPKECFEIADELIDIVQTKKNVHIHGKQRNQWADHIRKLNSLSNVTFDRMRSVIKIWQSDVEGEYDFWPHIESGKSFRDKFVQLETRGKAFLKQNRYWDPQ
jgi:hypothetical protein